jgi:hypothetical protein
MDWISYFSVDWSSLVNWVTDDIHDSAQSLWSDWNTDGCACIYDLLSSDQTFSRVHGNGSDS